MPADVVLVAAPARGVVQHRDELPSKFLGLAYVAAALELSGATVLVIDGKGERLTGEEVVRRTLEAHPRLVGFTAMTHEIDRCAELAAAVKSRDPSVATVVGGAHATATPGTTLEQYPQFDYACQGEGEHTAVELLQALAGNREVASVGGIFLRRDGRIVAAPERPRIADLDRLPFPAWHLFPRTAWFPVYTARGCPFSCVFCARTLGSAYRARSPGNVVAELAHLVDRHGATALSIEDETFLVDRARTRELLGLMIERGLSRIPWMANVHAATLDREMAELMARAGCISLGMGIESGSERVLARTGKGLTVRQARAAVAVARAAGLEVRAFFIFGHPGETRSDALDTIRLASALDPDRASFGIMVPYPGTEVARMAARGEGGLRVLSGSWRDFDKHLGNAMELTTLSRGELESLQAMAYLWLYGGNLRFADLARFLIRHRRAVAALSLRILAALVRRPGRWLGRAAAPPRGAVDPSEGT